MKRYLFICTSLILLLNNNLHARTDKYFGFQQKLSNSHVNKIYQDKSGYIWVCTDNGLNIFDGIEFKSYHHRENDTTSLNNNSVLTVLEDKTGSFWVGTTGGVLLLDREIEQFTPIRFSYPHVVDFSYINCIIEDRSGNIWLSTGSAGVICLKAGSRKPVYYMQTNSNICSDKINTLFEDRFGNIWIGSQDNGLSVLNVENHTLVNYSSQPLDPRSISSNKVFSIVELPNGDILIGTIDGGIDLYNCKKKSFTRNYIPTTTGVFTMINGSKNNLWIGSDGYGLKNYNCQTREISTYESGLINVDMRKVKVHSILEDLQGNLWVALYQKGVLMIPQKANTFHNVGFNPFYIDKNIGTECILTIIEDSNGEIWLGTDGDGIYRLNAERKVKKHYTTQSLPANVALTIFEDSKKRIWVGSYLYGLFLLNRPTDRFQKVPLSIGNKEIKDIAIIREDESGYLWIGTNEDGLCCYHHDTKRLTNFTYTSFGQPNQIHSNSIHSILFGKDSLVWVGTSTSGINCFDRKSSTFSYYNSDNGLLNNNNIFAITQDKAGNIWAGTKLGLYCINPQTETARLFTETDGLANASVYGIEIDKFGNLWISTSLGLSHYNTQSNTFYNYYASDGLQNDEYRRGAHFQSKSGELFFGGVQGLSSFFPFTTEISHGLTNLVFTSLYLYNEKVEINKGSQTILKRKIDATKEINIAYNIRSFSLGFAALEYNNPDKVVYQVKMDNFDKEWKTLPPGNRLATYTNLSHGRYTFRVRAYLSNTQPIEREIRVVITPPIWLTWWAKTIYLFIFLSILYFAYRFVKRRIKENNDSLQKENEALAMQSKLQFFTDISHEIRTPLTLVLTPIEKLLQETSDITLKNTYKRMYQNGQRILRLINQVMEMRKLDRGQMRLQASETVINEFINDIAIAFEPIIKDKQLHLDIDICDPLPTVWLDREKVDKVIFNVLSNAFKYTPEGGHIQIKVATEESYLKISITDSGHGIPAELQEVIFNRFYQIPNENNRNKMGTGIGLHISKSLMELHHGKIFVEQSSDLGSVFSILIPLSNSYLRPEEMMTEYKENDLSFIMQSSSYETEAIEQENKHYTNRVKSKILIVEDEIEIRSYLKEILNKEYTIIQAQNGIQGLELSIQELPDCVISDIMMPEMDGIELCRKIKTNDRTCHIPVILLTAKTTEEQRLRGLEVGADSYIPKPFNISHLKTRIYKLIELRRTIKDKYEGKHEIAPEKVTIKSFDEKFLEKLEQIVKERVSDSDLSIESISEEIGISRSQLQRKLKQLTNQNPSDYLKAYRLKYAAHLLTSKKLSISEVSYATGFSSLSHFSNSFREYFGMPPTRYVEINRKELGETAN